MDLVDPCVLVGAWRLARVIDDRLLGEVSHVEGELELNLAGADRLLWEERAIWHRHCADVAVRRGLHLERTDDGWWVRFEDGRDFHPWQPGEQVVHDCAPDTYRGTVTGTADGWSVVWEATGPEKDYRMTTQLTR